MVVESAQSIPHGVSPATGADSEIASDAACDIAVDRARVEWRDEPLGIDTLRPRFRWELRSAHGRRGVVQAACRVRVVAREGARHPGATVWDSEWVATSVPGVSPDSDLELDSLSRYEWYLTVEDASGCRGPESSRGGFVTGVLTEADWKSSWVAAAQPASLAADERLPLLRTAFVEKSRVARAYLAVVGLGHYTLSVNGSAVADGDLASGWSDYRRTVLYDCHDVTELITTGDNVVGIMLGNGFFSVEEKPGRYTKFVGEPQRLTARLRLRLIFTDGSERTIGTGEDWASAPGPVTFSSIFGGEDHDARLELPGWSTRAGGGDAFTPVELVPGPAGRLVANPVPAVGVVDRIDATDPHEPAPGILVFDLGTNVAGRPRLVLEGVAAGRAVSMKPAEMLLPDGTIDQRSATGGNSGYDGIAFTYTNAGRESETWAPRFTYTGFRYLQVEGARRSQIRAVGAEVLRAKTELVGTFACSDPMLTRIHELIVGAVLGNMVSILTDCPHREKLGWLEQYYLNSSTVMYNADAAALYEKMLADVGDAQLENGMVPSIAPEFVAFVDDSGANTAFRDSPEWGSAVILAAWDAYRFHGDRRILENNYHAMGRYLGFLESRRHDGVLHHGLGDWYDLGPKLPGPSQLTSAEFSGTATLLADLRVLAKIAAVLGREADGGEFTERADGIRDVLNARYFDGHSYDRGSQSANAMALALDLPGDDNRPAVVESLVADITANGMHVSAGDIGFHYVVRALGDNGQSAVLADILTEESAPSYGHQLSQGATTLTEAWDAYAGSSQNHFMLGHAEGWLYGGLGGIRMCFGDAEADLVIAPQPVPGVDWADVTYHSVFGAVRSFWRTEGDTIRLDVVVPVGARAIVVIPGSDGRGLLESGLPVEHNVPVPVGRFADGTGFALRVGSGEYSFSAPLAPGHIFDK